MIGKKKAFSRSGLAVLLVSLLAAVILLPVNSQALIGIKEGDNAKNIVLSDLNGKTVNTAEFFGSRPVIIVFWELVFSDSFLDYSLDELRFLNDVYNKYHKKKGLEIFAIYTPEKDEETSDSELSKVREIIQLNKIAFPVLIDHGLKIFREYGVIALPSTIMFNKAGTIESIYPSFPLAARQAVSDQIKILLGLSSLDENKPEAVKDPGNDSKTHRLYQYALQMYKSGLHEQAFSALNKSLASDEKYSLAHNLKGVILWKRGSAAGAAEEFQNAISLGNNIVAHINYAILLADQGRYAESENIIKSASYTRVDLKVRAHYLLGLAYKNMNKADLAIRELEVAESLFDVWADEKKRTLTFIIFPTEYPYFVTCLNCIHQSGMTKKPWKGFRRQSKLPSEKKGARALIIAASVKITWYMNKIVTSAFISLIFCFSLSQSLPGAVHAITTPEEYISHTKGSASCATQQCHPDFTVQTGKFLHDPVLRGECSHCHSAEAYPNRYGLEKDQRPVCGECHKEMDHEINSSTVVHAPIMNGDCTSCHDPHQSTWPFFLRKSYNELCISCHNPSRLYTGGFLHKPVKDGNCGLCHDPHASNFKSRLIDAGFNLCLICHDEMVTGMTKNYIHTTIIKSGCSGCHDPHAGGNKLRLKETAEKLCFTCHKAKYSEVNQYTRKHRPAVEGKCLDCHSPHYSDVKYLLRDKVDVLCYKCHEKSIVWKEKRYQHGPVVQGDCSACHNPHGSDNAFILRLPFPHKFYTEYEKGKYSLCFLCHKESLVTVDSTETVTEFRNGRANLHRLHVNQTKGRTCRACHDVHASNQEGRIRDEFPFGKMFIRLKYSKTDTGGSCVPGCHMERRYDRVNRVRYER